MTEVWEKKKKKKKKKKERKKKKKKKKKHNNLNAAFKVCTIYNIVHLHTCKTSQASQAVILMALNLSILNFDLIFP